MCVCDQFSRVDCEEQSNELKVVAAAAPSVAAMSFECIHAHIVQDAAAFAYCFVMVYITDMHFYSWRSGFWFVASRKYSQRLIGVSTQCNSKFPNKQQMMFLVHGINREWIPFFFPLPHRRRWQSGCCRFFVWPLWHEALEISKIKTHPPYRPNLCGARSRCTHTAERTPSFCSWKWLISCVHESNAIQTHQQWPHNSCTSSIP